MINKAIKKKLLATFVKCLELQMFQPKMTKMTRVMIIVHM